MTDLYKGNIFQIRNRIACGFGTKFKRDGDPYRLIENGNLQRIGNPYIYTMDYFIKAGWSLLP